MVYGVDRWMVALQLSVTLLCEGRGYVFPLPFCLVRGGEENIQKLSINCNSYHFGKK